MLDNDKSRTALITGATGQDGSFLTEKLLEEGWMVIAVARRTPESQPTPHPDRLRWIQLDVLDAQVFTGIIRETRPQEIYNLAGVSSVAASFDDPRRTWSTNVDAVVTLLEAVRLYSPESRVYQASSSEMFGYVPNESVIHDERSPLRPASPYAAAKAAAHLLCQSYRESFGVRVACGILFNHESRRRPESFLTSKIASHARLLSKTPRTELRNIPPLELGNLKVKRDWGFAPDYVDGMIRVLRQVDIRSERFAPVPDVAASYRDYVLGTGRTYAVWELVDTAFSLAGHELVWKLDGNDPCTWTARFASTGTTAVQVNAAFVRPNDPIAIQADPSRAENDLGWKPVSGVSRLLADMLDIECPVR